MSFSKARRVLPSERPIRYEKPIQQIYNEREKRDKIRKLKRQFLQKSYGEHVDKFHHHGKYWAFLDNKTKAQLQARQHKKYLRSTHMPNRNTYQMEKEPFYISERYSSQEVPLRRSFSQVNMRNSTKYNNPNNLQARFPVFLQGYNKLQYDINSILEESINNVDNYVQPRMSSQQNTVNGWSDQNQVLQQSTQVQKTTKVYQKEQKQHATVTCTHQDLIDELENRCEDYEDRVTELCNMNNKLRDDLDNEVNIKNDYLVNQRQSDNILLNELRIKLQESSYDYERRIKKLRSQLKSAKAKKQIVHVVKKDTEGLNKLQQRINKLLYQNKDLKHRLKDLKIDYENKLMKLKNDYEKRLDRLKLENQLLNKVNTQQNQHIQIKHISLIEAQSWALEQRIDDLNETMKELRATIRLLRHKLEVHSHQTVSRYRSDVKCNHILKYVKALPSYDGLRYSCNICRTSYYIRDGVYHCGNCNFDVCHKCVEQQKHSQGGQIEIHLQKEILNKERSFYKRQRDEIEHRHNEDLRYHEELKQKQRYHEELHKDRYHVELNKDIHRKELHKHSHANHQHIHAIF